MDDVTPRRVSSHPVLCSVIASRRAYACHAFDRSTSLSPNSPYSTHHHHGQAEQALLGAYHATDSLSPPAPLTAARRPPAQRQLRRRMDARPAPVPPVPRLAPVRQLLRPFQSRSIPARPHERRQGQRAAAREWICLQAARLRREAARQPDERECRAGTPPFEWRCWPEPQQAWSGECEQREAGGQRDQRRAGSARTEEKQRASCERRPRFGAAGL